VSAPVRFLLIGDVHLREGAQLDDVEQALRAAADVADEYEVSAVLMAGDLFEGKSTPAERLVLGEALRRLTGEDRDLGRPVVIVKGNHDQPHDLEVFRGYDCVFVHERVGVVGISGVDVICLPWPERAFLAAYGRTGEAADVAGGAAVVDVLRAQRAMLDPRRPFVVLAHLQVNGAVTSSAQPLIGGAIEVALGELQDLGAAAVVLGHVHRPQELAPNVHYVGSLTCHDHGEEGETKRVGLLTIGDDGAAAWEWLPVPCRRWVTIEAEVVGDGHDEPHVQEDSSDGSYDFANACVRYRYTCDESEQHLFDEPAIRRRFAAAHTLKVESEINRATASRAGAAEVAAARSVADKLRAYGEAAGVEITPAMLEKLHTMESEVAHRLANLVSRWVSAREEKAIAMKEHNDAIKALEESIEKLSAQIEGGGFQGALPFAGEAGVR